MPVAPPSTAFVPKKARFFVSRGFSSVHSTVRARGSDSPVNDELSTFNLWFVVTRMSAGILSPSFTSMTSPTTISAAGMLRIFPSRCTRDCGGRKFLNFSIVFSDLNSWKKLNRAVMMTTMYSTQPSTRFSTSLGLRPNAMKQRMDAIWSSSAKKLRNCIMSLMYHGVVLGGESWFGPSRSSLILASPDDRPVCVLVPSLDSSSSTVSLCSHISISFLRSSAGFCGPSFPAFFRSRESEIR
mmetsp:Transcript_12534/g.38296  ORF Transcript_12534/g.38296 Transcript_12534/m.38296 type:complete len:241 (-) Transcript_12534:260-982(-)